MEILKVDSIVKQYGTYRAVDNVSFSVSEGKIFGLLGPNGAGKTTTIRIITDIILPDSGEVYLFDEKMNPSLQDEIGYLPEERGLYKKYKVIEQLEYFGMLKGLTQRQANSRAKYWLNRVGADGWENKKIEELSKGMAQKVQFIITVMHNPKFIILDEPFSGFDPINTDLIKHIIMELKEQGTTFILSTHQMHQVEMLCDEILMINMGKVVLEGNLRDVKKNYGKNHLIIEFSGTGSFLNNIEKDKIIDISQNRLEMKISNYAEAQEILRQAAVENEITKFEIVEPSLNEIFIDVVQKSMVEYEKV
ncbi:MAG TPA: ATP-binding cassette domain-containing protein [Candidatus Kapabacteria bacterium]|jgi:ABC-2 type transport system ATP-binding protein|nr:ATP-binding cassette domain-containing protein [Candidatus Kapabacteria bacterium]HOV92789.1 ATP-binding cassette domain-containing protein [Candidatus Kapabacteria bacterium]